MGAVAPSFGTAFCTPVTPCRVQRPNQLTDIRYGADTAAPGREPLWPVGTFDPPLHRSMEVLGRPDKSVCGIVVFVGDDDQLAEYSLTDGP
jgi:hypothetical protein